MADAYHGAKSLRGRSHVAEGCPTVMFPTSNSTESGPEQRRDDGVLVLFIYLSL